MAVKMIGRMKGAFVKWFVSIRVFLLVASTDCRVTLDTTEPYVNSFERVKSE